MFSQFNMSHLIPKMPGNLFGDMKIPGLFGNEEKKKPAAKKARRNRRPAGRKEKFRHYRKRILSVRIVKRKTSFRKVQQAGIVVHVGKCISGE